MRKILLILFLLLVASQIGYSQKKTRILFIFDASNSMRGHWSDGSKIDIAKKILSATVDSLKEVENLELALRVYGHQSPITPTYQDCDDTKLEVPFGKSNHDQIKTTIYNIDPKGTTPIARSLEASADDFPDKKANNIIILITDGLEACDKDPCIVARKLKEKGINVKPFVVGIGIDLEYLKAFNCIGTVYNAEDENSFKNVINNVVNKAINNTSLQINLNTIEGNPIETNVTMHLYKAGTKDLKYTFTHTLNQYGKPDTLIVNPNINYDVVVHTIPPVGKKNNDVVKGQHNIIEIDAPQGIIKVQFQGSYDKKVPVIVRENGKMKTLNIQQSGENEKYIIDTYDLEILTLPRIYTSVEVTQSKINYVNIPLPGKIMYQAYYEIVGQLFLVKDNQLEWLYNIDDNDRKGFLDLLPGEYEIVYRKKTATSTSRTKTLRFTVNPGSNQTLNLK